MTPDLIAISGVGLALAGVDGPAGLLATLPGEAAPFDPVARLGRKGLRYKDRATRLALCAAGDALHDGALVTGDAALAVPGASVGVVVSSNFGNVDTVCEVAAAIPAETTSGIGPMALPNASSNVIASSVAIRYGLRGPNITLCNGPSSGLDAVYWAAFLVAAGRCAVSLVIGVEPRNEHVARLTGVAADDLLDGAVALLVEREESARGRGVPATARLGPYAREGSVAACLTRILPEGRPAGIWFVPERYGGAGHDRVDRATRRHDLTAGLGRASGALGVLQCAAAAGWLAAGGSGTAVATSGDDNDDGVAGLLLTGGGTG
jgi:3-oxoacyl-[acyl-carrier-protein] synthase II